MTTNRQTTAGIIFLFCALVLITATSNAQTYFLETGQLPIHHYVEQENKAGSVARENRNRYINTSAFELAQPFTFVRTNRDIQPAPVVRYHFSLPDSIVREIHLEIDSLNFLDQAYQTISRYKEPPERMEVFLREYDIIAAELISLFGKPGDSTGLHQETSNRALYWQQSMDWDNDSVSISLFMIFTENPATTAMGTYRIRASIYYKKSNSGTQAQDAGSTAKGDKSEQDSVARLYLGYLFDENYQASWELLDESIQKQTPYSNYIAIASRFKELKKTYGRDVELYMAGVTFSLQVGRMVVYTYKFKIDTNQPPSVAIDISFREAGSLKIVGINPKGLVR